MNFVQTRHEEVKTDTESIRHLFQCHTLDPSLTLKSTSEPLSHSSFSSVSDIKSDSFSMSQTNTPLTSSVSMEKVTSKFKTTLNHLGLTLNPEEIQPIDTPFITKLKASSQMSDQLLEKQYFSTLNEFESKVNRILPSSKQALQERLELLNQIQEYSNLIIASKSKLIRHFEKHSNIKKCIQISHPHQRDFVALLNQLDGLSKKANFMFDTLCSEIEFNDSNEHEDLE